MTIQVSDLTVQLGAIVAIDSLTVDLEGPITAVVGPNGAGKTTFVNVLSGFVRPVRGTVHIDGEAILELAPHVRTRRGLRRTFQSEQVIGDLTLFDNVAIMADSVAGTGTRTEMVDAVLEFVGLGDDLERLGWQLNAFERRLTEIARALIGEPLVVLLDEPAAGLSPTETAHLRWLVTDIPRFCGAHVVLIEHDVDLVVECCPSTMVLDFGKLIAYGETSEILESPEVKAAYLGEPFEGVA